MLSRRLGTLVLTVIACTAIAQAQSSQTSGAIRGVVKNQAGVALTEAKINVRNLETGFSRTAVTDGRGSYLVPMVPLGDYEVTVTHPKMQTGRNGRLRVSLSETTVQNFTLDKIEASATVTVTASASAVDAQQINSSTSVSQDMVSAIPINGRNFTDLVQLTPGAVANSQGYRTAVDGARGVQNNLMIDGASFNSNFAGESRGGTRVPFGFGIDSIRELQVITNAYDTQFGNAAGAIINAVTKTGTNEVTGMIGTQLRPGSLVANEKPVPSDPTGVINTPLSLQRKFSQQEYAANIGGPIIKDVLHYFVNIDYLHASTQSVPAVAPTYGEYVSGSSAGYNTFFGAGGMGNIIASPSGASLGQELTQPWTDDQKHLTFLIRLDWTINPTNHASLRVNSQTYTGLNDIYAGVRQSNRAGSDESTMKFNSLSWVAELESVLGPNLMNDARLQVASEHRPTTPNSLSPAVDLPGYYAGGYYIDPRNTDEKTTQIMDTLTYVDGPLSVKGGIDWQFIKYNNTFYPDSRGEISFTTWDAANAWYAAPGYTAPTGLTPGITYYQDYAANGGTVAFNEKLFATFLQTSFSGLMNNRLTLSAGVRYTREMWDGNFNSNPQLQGTDQMPNNGSVDPRFGFALDVFGDNRTVVRGGFGLFSNPNAAQTVASSFENNGINMKAYKLTNAANGALFFGSGALSSANLIQNNQMSGLSPAQLAALPATTLTASIIDPNAKETQAHRASLEVEQDLGHGYVVKVKGMYQKTYNLQYWINVNMSQADPISKTPIPGAFYSDGYAPNNNNFKATAGYHPGHAVVAGRTLDLSTFGDVYLSKYDGRGEYKSLSFELSKVSSNGFSFNTNLTLSSSRDNNSNENATAGGAGGSPVDPSNPLYMSRSDNDTPVRFVFMGKLPPVYGIFVSGTFTWASGLPWSPANYTDVNGDNLYNDYALGGRNSMRQPNIKSFNMALTRSFYLNKGLRLDVAAQVFNVFNWANQNITSAGANSLYYINAAGVTNPANFGQVNGLDQKTREVQFNVKLSF